MKDNTYADCVNRNFLSNWNAVAELRKPIIAAVNGYAVSLPRTAKHLLIIC